MTKSNIGHFRKWVIKRPSSETHTLRKMSPIFNYDDIANLLVISVKTALAYCRFHFLLNDYEYYVDVLSSIMLKPYFNLNLSLLKHYMLPLGRLINKYECIHQYANDMQIYFKLTSDTQKFISTLSDSVILTL